MSNVEKERQRWRNPKFVTGRHDFGNTHTILIPGEEWHPLDGTPAPEYVPEQWDGPHVGLRLVEAFKTLANTPDRGSRLDSASGFWPETWPEFQDLLAQEGQQDVKQETVEKANRARVCPSTQEITRMEMALCWPAEHLSGDDPELARIVQRVAFYRSLEMDMGYVARRMRVHAKLLRDRNRTALDLIASGLRRCSVPVF